jgi:uridine kinase
MNLVIISGPSGSGKTTLSNQILEKIKNAFVLSTDNYYKTGIISKLLSKFIAGYFDRSISFDLKLFKEDFNYIIKNGISMYERSYNFERKKIKKFIKETNNINFLIVEGIFAKEFSSTLYNKNYLFLELEINKNECLKRVLQRDLIERGKPKKQAKNDFLRSWKIYYSKRKDKNINNNANEFLITKTTNIDQILKKIFNLKS